VLLSREGRYEEARAALAIAIRNNPAFALAQENLGDVYAALAAQAYARSAELDPASASPRPKLALIRQLLARPAS
jgi:tetratricopeptide (TPR) repeat protein